MFPFDRIRWNSPRAQQRIRKGRLPDRMRVAGQLDLSNSGWLSALPRRLEADSINVSNCAKLRELPEHVRCGVLMLMRTNVECLHAGLNVAQQIDASNCLRLRYVAPLKVRTLFLRNCRALERVSDYLTVQNLDLSRCTRFVELPGTVASHLRILDVSGCTSFAELPPGLTRLDRLDVSGCTSLKELPPDIQVSGWIEAADSGLERPLPYLRYHWRGVPVSDRLAFYPETITAEEIIGERNLELRRVMIERVGMDWFVERTNARVVDNDEDAGGPRRLLKIQFENGVDMACIEVHCPSTGRKYVLQVPPEIPTCAHAAAWMAGFSNPARYRPVVET
jgi:hypothetical protein